MVKINVIAKISWYLERSVVTLKLRKEYLNTVTRNTPVLLRIKYWTNWHIDRYSMSTYMRVTNFQKTVRFFGRPCIFDLIGMSTLISNIFWQQCLQVRSRASYFLIKPQLLVRSLATLLVSLGKNTCYCHPRTDQNLMIVNLAWPLTFDPDSSVAFVL